MSYDPGREDEKLENRLIREIDRRFTAVENQIAEIDKQITALDEKVSTNFKEIAANKRESYIWLVRMVVTSVISIIASAGAFYFLELLRGVHP